MKILPTKIVENFFSDDELMYVKSLPFLFSELNHATYDEDNFKYKPWNGTVVRRYLAFNDDPQYSKVNQILEGAVKKHFGENIIIGAKHILTAFYPYLSHTDAVYGEYGIDENHYGAYTFVIPLDTFQSSTIVYNEYSDKTKMVSQYKQDKEPIDSIDDAFYEKYLTHEARENMRYLSVEKVFNWKQNNCLAMSRYKFHGSDDFYGHGVQYKQAMIMWTYAPY
jgi:hypothetical protein